MSALAAGSLAAAESADLGEYQARVQAWDAEKRDLVVREKESRERAEKERQEKRERREQLERLVAEAEAAAQQAL